MKTGIFPRSNLQSAFVLFRRQFCAAALSSTLSPSPVQLWSQRKVAVLGSKLKKKAVFINSYPLRFSFGLVREGQREVYESCKDKNSNGEWEGSVLGRIFASGLYRHLANAIHAMATGIPASYNSKGHFCCNLFLHYG